MQRQYQMLQIRFTPLVVNPRQGLDMGQMDVPGGTSWPPTVGTYPRRLKSDSVLLG